MGKALARMQDARAWGASRIEPWSTPICSTPSTSSFLTLLVLRFAFNEEDLTKSIALIRNGMDKWFLLTGVAERSVPWD
jgi:hypothetical protein